MRWFVVLFVAVAAAVVLSIDVSAQSININVTNETVYVSFQNLTVVDFTTTRLNLGWVNSSHLGCAYSCLYMTSPEQDCDAVRVQVFDGTLLVYQVDFVPSYNNTDLCPPDLKGICTGFAVFNVSGFQDVAKVLVVNLDTNETRGPIDFVFPYQGPQLEGYARYIPVLVPYGILMSLAGRLGMKNVGIGLVIFGLITPAMTVLGIDIKNLLLASGMSIIMGVILIWVSNQ